MGGHTLGRGNVFCVFATSEILLWQSLSPMDIHLFMHPLRTNKSPLSHLAT